MENTIATQSRAIPVTHSPGICIIGAGAAGVKLSAVEGAHRQFKGKAKVYEDEDIAMKKLGEGEIAPGDIVILRMGPVGGPGTVFTCGFMAALAGAGLVDTVAVVTDGELSGLNKGITIGQVMPGAAMEGPLAIIENGYSITIDLNDKCIDVELSEEEYQGRLSNWKMKARKLTNNWLKFYSENVQPLERGAVFGRRN